METPLLLPGDTCKAVCSPPLLDANKGKESGRPSKRERDDEAVPPKKKACNRDVDVSDQRTIDEEYCPKFHDSYTDAEREGVLGPASIFKEFLFKFTADSLYQDDLALAAQLLKRSRSLISLRYDYFTRFA